MGWTGQTVLGVVVLLRPESAVRPDPSGSVLALLAALCWALYIVFARNIAGSLPSGQACSLGMLGGGAAVFMPCTIPALWVGIQTPLLLGVSVIVALCSSALPYTLEMQAMQKLSARNLACCAASNPFPPR